LGVWEGTAGLQPPSPIGCALATERWFYKGKAIPVQSWTGAAGSRRSYSSSGGRKKFLPKRRAFSVFICGVTMEKVLEKVYEDSYHYPCHHTIFINNVHKLPVNTTEVLQIFGTYNYVIFLD
jgi:hypothetical protein